MAATPSLKVIKSFEYKGNTQAFSNRYHFNGGTPSDASHWHTLMDAVVADEAPIYHSGITITEAIGYNAGSDVPVASKTYSTAGTLSIPSGCHPAPGDSCCFIRYSTTARTPKNHPVYLFNYYHGVLMDNPLTDGQDFPPSEQSDAYSEYAADWIAGFSDGTITAVRAGPNGATATGSFVHPWITHRDFPG